MRTSSNVSRWSRSFVAALLLPAAVGCGSTPEAATSQGTAAVQAQTGTGGSNASMREGAAKGAAAGTSAWALAGAAAPMNAAASSGAASSGMTVAGAGGAPHAAAGGMVAQPAGSAPTLTQIYEMVYTMKCAACHTMAPNDNQNGKLGMLRSKDLLYAALVNKPAQGSMCTGKGTYVVPGNPELSLLIQKLSGKPPCGVTMPLGSSLDPTLVEMLSDWIAAAALNN